MKLRFKGTVLLLPLLLLALAARLTWAELQGPVETKAKSAEIDGESAVGSDSATEGPPTKSNDETDSSASGSTERKASKYLTEKPNALPTSLPGIEAAGNTVPTELLVRLLNENVEKEKLKEQIEAVEERRRSAAVPVDPTPLEIEAHTFYEQAMEMLAKPRADKQVAYTLMRKAASLQHGRARAEMAWAHLLGHYLQFDFEYAAAEFNELALEGVPEANMGLAYLYAVGVGGKNISQPLTLIHLTLAALGDHTFAQMALGYRYSFGINVPVSCEKSLSFYKKVAKKVASKVTFSSGPLVHRVRLLDESENPGSHETDIVDYYQLLADKGDVQSQVGLGQLYYQGGKAIQQDHQKALEYFTQAAKSGNAIGFAFLGKLYLEGSDYIKADNDTAFQFFKKAADLGDPVGQSGLGLMYLNGLGVAKDVLKAFNYFTQAADQGWVDGQLQLGKMYFSGNGVKTDFKLALKYFNLASQSGHVLAYYNLGIMHAYGMGIMRSCPTAVEFFKNVAERGRWSSTLMNAYADYKGNRPDAAYMQYALLAEMGYEVAQGNAAYLLDKGEVTIFHDRHEDLIRAFYYWKRAAAQSYSAAQVKLGDYYYYGWGTGVDFETAAALYRKASEQQYNAQAMFNLGYMHEQGLGMKKDWHLAKRLYDLAAETNADAKVPVAIALLKLQLLAKMEAIKESPYKFIFYLDESIAANWDLYMITILTLLLGVIMYTRRPYQQQQQPQADLPADDIQQQQPTAAAATAATPANENADDTAPANDSPSLSCSNATESEASKAASPASTATAETTAATTSLSAGAVGSQSSSAAATTTTTTTTTTTPGSSNATSTAPPQA